MVNKEVSHPFWEVAIRITDSVQFCFGPVKSGISTTPTFSCDDKLFITEAGIRRDFFWVTLVDISSFSKRGPSFQKKVPTMELLVLE